MNQTNHAFGSRIVLEVACWALLVTLFFLVAAKADVYSDFINHSKLAERITNEGQVPAHPLFHVLSLCLSVLFSVSVEQSGIILVGISTFLSFLVCLNFLHQKKNRIYFWWKSLLVAGLFFLHAVPLLFFYDRHLYLGYVTGTAFHNPTILLLKPLACLHFLWVSRIFGDKSGGLKEGLILFFLTILTILAKPSYMFTFLPAMGIVILFFSVVSKNEEKKKLKLYLWAVLLPSLFLFLWQFKNLFVLSVQNSNSKNGIGFAPLDLFLTHSSLWTVGPKTFLSLLFPGSIIALYFNKIKDDIGFWFAFVNLIIALIFNFCFVETGSRFYDGNFGWSAQIGLFLLNLTCLEYLLRRLSSGRKIKLLPVGDKVVLLFFSCQVISGLIWFASNLGFTLGRFYP